jgi:hypothetical protein
MTESNHPFSEHLGNETITCRDSVRFVSLCRDGEISQEDHHLLLVHVDACPHCKVAHAQFQALFSGIEMLLGNRPGE